MTALPDTPPGPSIALATCRDLPDWEVDDGPLRAALDAAGAAWADVPWDDGRVDWSSFDAVLVRTTWDYTRRKDEFVAWARRVEAATRLFNPAEVIEWNTDKRYLRSLEAAGVPVIPTIWIERGERPRIAERLAGTGWARAFLKPSVGATAEGTLPFDVDPAGLEAAETHAAGLLAERSVLLQPFLDRVRTEGECSMILVDGEVAHGVRKVPVPGDYRVQDDFGAHDEPWRPGPDDLKLGRRAVDATGFDLLYARVDLIADDQGRLRLTELELVEPSLFLRHGPNTAELLVRALLARIGAVRTA